MTATVLDVAVLAGVGIEQWSKAVSGGGGRWRDHPGAAEKTVAHGEVHAPRRRQVGRGQRKGVLITLAHRRRACGPGFAGFGLGKTRDRKSTRLNSSH